ncbi:endonuclease/exonuclease/phosphatase family protein [uncultured Jatrophihabitans sp.]|uniref:endonuclease/exonuclease/phosphatase family protein n=1 Tax=uncultured Jatrophihabitans sp. TaxID=1610747 RepID=UPI0035C995A3
MAIAALTLALGAATTVAAGPASAASTWPGKPSGVRVSGAGNSWLTVSLRSAVHARSYRLFASTTKSDIYYDNLIHGRHSSARHTATSSRPSLSLHGMRYTSAPIYYRVVALNGSKASYSAGIGQTALRPATPWSLTVHTSAAGTYLTWGSQAATGYTIATATNSSMTAGRRNFSIIDQSHAFTPSGLTKGVRYYFTVRALNGSMPSHYAGIVSAVVQSRQQSMRLMSYNILNLGADRTREAGGVVAPWSQRRAPAVALIKSANPDVVGIQEGNWWADATHHILQVDSLRNGLGGTYTLAHTEPRYGESDWKWFRTGNYILYKPSTYRAVGAGGNWHLGAKAYAVYQVLQNKASGARVLVVNTHLTQPGGYSNDLARQSEMRSMVSGANARAHGLPVVYVGDFNSNNNPKQYRLDGPGSIMRSSRIADARLVAQSHVNPHWDSANDYMRAPYHYDLYIDYLCLTPGVSATSWGMAMRMSHGRFVGTIPSDHNPIWTQLQFPY